LDALRQAIVDRALEVSLHAANKAAAGAAFAKITPDKPTTPDARARKAAADKRKTAPPISPSRPTRLNHRSRIDDAARRADSCSPTSFFMRHRVRRRRREWERIGASGQVLSWIRHGVRVKIKHGVWPKPFNHGISILDATPAQLEFLSSELHRFEACGAWERSDKPRYVSMMFLVPEPGCNLWRLIIDLRELNRYY
jgi:hypothetical protein